MVGPFNVLSAEQRKKVVTALLVGCSWPNNQPKLAWGALTRVAISFATDRSTISRIWKRARLNLEEKQQLTASPLTSNQRGQPIFYDRQELAAAMADIPTNKRGSLRSIARELGISTTTVHRLKAGKGCEQIIVPHSNAVKPMLTDQHMTARVFYCLSKFNVDTGCYSDFYQSVHIDEKWFFMTREQLRIYMSINEIEQDNFIVRRVAHKSHIIKVMFLAATARPRYDAQGNCTFDGKIGIWPIIELVEAQRSSPNRPAGTMETKPVSLDRALYRRMMITLVLPAIRQRFPGYDKNVKMQQDGAPAHIEELDPQFIEAATVGNWNISLETQPARSPDLNHLDLSFFRALQSAQWARGFASNINELVTMVTEAYWDFPSFKIEKGFVTLATVIDQILVCRGDNTYKIPHIGKDRMIRDGTLPRWYPASEPAIEFVEEMQDLEDEIELDDLAAQLQEWEEADREHEELTHMLQEWEEEDVRNEQEVLQWLEEEEINDLALFVEENYGD